MYDGKVQVVEHLYNCDGTEDFSSMILLSVMRKLEIIWTTTTTLMIPPGKIFKGKAGIIEPMEVRGINTWEFQI